jgi:hypothetical protein
MPRMHLAAGKTPYGPPTERHQWMLQQMRKEGMGATVDQHERAVRHKHGQRAHNDDDMLDTAGATRAASAHAIARPTTKRAMNARLTTK